MESPIVEVADGKIRGFQKTDFNGDKFYTFLGIPYARPMVGSLRFKDPLPAQPWTGVKDATKVGEQCYQREFLEAVYGGSEDCLHLNVYSKQLPVEKKSLKPVMVFIHGGGFASGSNSPKMYGPEHLMTEDIVLVSVNYRVGILGFLSLEDASLEIPGNAGLKDQTLALKWIQLNIDKFNGDPKNVTIFGESAGGASVHYQILSPSAKGLFHKAILQSGAVLNPWATGPVNVVEFLKSLKKEAKNEKEILEILRSTPVEDLIVAQNKYQIGGEKGYSVVGPVIEKPNPNAFITKNPIDIITSGEYNQVPMIFGYTSNEGMVIELATLIKDPNIEPKRDKAFSIDSLLPFEAGSEIGKAMKEKIMSFYFQGKNAENKHLFFTDSFFLAGIIASVKNHYTTSSHPIYLYRMSLSAGLNFLKKYVKCEHAPGACHMDDIGYLFHVELMKPEKPANNSIEAISLRRFVKLWTNFAKHGNPTPDESELNILWKPVDKLSLHFLDIDTELTVSADPEPERMQVWKEIYQSSLLTEKYL